MNIVENLKSKIQDKTFRVGIIGLGYVGLPLLWTFHKLGFDVVGFDVDESKIESMNTGKSYIKHFSDEQMSILTLSERCFASTDFSLLQEMDAIIICVPTPLNRHREPDMSYVESTTYEISKFLRKGQLVVLESTTWPGTTDELMGGILEKESGLEVGKDFYLAYSPEREDPGNIDFNTQSIPKIVGAKDRDSRELVLELYNAVIDKVIPVSSSKVAESAKLLENIFRSVNIALVNEMKIVMDAMDIDVHEVIEAAATKPFGFMKFTPGPGLGGHCIPIDPFYLSWKAREYGLSTRFIELAGEVNSEMPKFVIDKTILALNDFEKAIKGSNILILGIAYKPDVDDMRESPSFAIMDKLKELGANISYFDPWIPKIPKSREHMNWYNTSSIEWEKEKIESFDACIISTNHKDVNYEELSKWSKCIVDSRNVYSREESGVFKNVYRA